MAVSLAQASVRRVLVSARGPSRVFATAAMEGEVAKALQEVSQRRDRNTTQFSSAGPPRTD
jgi:hypothetical protein